MYCKKFNAKLFSHECAKRQHIAKERKITNEQLNSLSKCYNCKLGKKIKNLIEKGYTNLIDKEIKKIYNHYLEKPKKIKLKVTKKLKLKIKGQNGKT